MKVCIVTIIDNMNYGTYLQALALNNVIKEKNNDVLVLNYERECMRPWNIIKNRLKNSTSIKHSIIVYFTQLILCPIKKLSLFNETKKFVKYTRKYVGSKKIYKNIPKADLYITGSDQVWNLDYNAGIDKVFYLDFVPSYCTKCSYASSIGMNNFPEEYKEELSLLFNTYKYITIRERDSLVLFQKLGIMNVKAVLDPTLLIPRDKWIKIFNLKKRESNYVLIYSVEKDKTSKLITIGKEIATRLHCKLVLIENGNPLLRKRKNVDKIVYSPSIREFLELFCNSKFVVASSFHGTAFSINFNKQFIVVQPPKFNVRINSLLSEIGLSERAFSISEEDNEFPYEKLGEIDYEIINKRIDELRNYSMEQLNKILNVGK